MKTITLLVYLFLFSISIYAQIPRMEVPVVKGELQIDSIVKTNNGNPEIKIICKYSSDGKMVERSDYSWDKKTNNWKGDSKDYYEFNNLGHTHLEINYRWNSLTNDWLFKSKKETVYDKNGSPTLITDYFWIEFDEYENKEIRQWSLSSKKQQEYNDDNEIILEVIEGPFVKSSKREYSYSVLGKLSTIIAYQWIENTWQYGLKYEYTYENNTMKMELYYWDDIAKAWTENPYLKEEHVYNDAEKLISQKYYYSDESTSGLKLENMFEYLYDKDGEIATTLSYYSWNEIKQEWMTLKKSEYECYAKDNLIFKSESGYSFDKENNTFTKHSFIEKRYDSNENEVYYYEWDISNGSILEERIINSFDEKNHLISKTHYLWDENTSDLNKYAEYIYSYDKHGNALTETHYYSQSQKQFTYYYSPLSTDIPSISNNTITISPNPVSDVFFINGLNNKAELFLSNMNGQIVFYQKEIENNSSVSIADLPQGIYIAKIVSGKESITKKIVKR